MAEFNDLHKALTARDCAKLKQLVQEGTDVNFRDSMMRTPLHSAAFALLGGDSKMKDAIQTLVDLGADINAADLEGKTPLHYSLLREYAEFFYEKKMTADVMKQRMQPLTQEQIRHVVRDKVNGARMSAAEFFVGLGADINATFNHKVTSLHRAIQLNIDIRGIKTLLRLGVDVNAMKWIKCTALHHTLDPKGIMLLKRLVELGADINSSYSLVPPLLQAVELGRMDIIKMLLQHRVIIAPKEDYTPVTCAVIHQKCPDVVKTLAQLGADLNAQVSTSTIVNEIVKVGRVDILEYLAKYAYMTIGYHRRTALVFAIHFDYHEMVECLLKCGADANVEYSGKISPLVTAMRLRDTVMVKALAKLEPKILHLTINKNKTALQRANKIPRTMALLLKYGGDVNLKYSKICPVHYAVAQGDEEMLRLLAELGADMNSGKVEGESLLHDIIKPLNLAGKQDNMAIKRLVEAGLDLNQCYTPNVRPLHDAVRLGDARMVQILGELKANMNASKSSETPIFKAMSVGRTDLIRYFVANGANVNSRITSDMTPLHDAVCHGNADMVRVLINSGASQNDLKHIGTALYWAVALGDNDVVKCLLESGADINAKGCSNISALHDAVENSDLAMVSALLYSGSPTNGDQPDITETLVNLLQDEHKTPLDAGLLELSRFIRCDIEDRIDEITPLGVSITEDQIDITETLLKYGADINCLQDIKRSPLDVALDTDNIECALLLMSQNVRANRDTMGSSPLHTACQFGYIDLARLLIIEGSDISKSDYNRITPLELLPLAKGADYHVLQESVNVENVTEQVPMSFVSTSGCQDMATSLHTSGIGDVRFISSPSATEVSESVNRLLTSIIKLSQCKAYSEGKLKAIGSSAEGTRVGLPNEMDFLFRVELTEHEQKKIVQLGNGYATYGYVWEELINLQQAIKDTPGVGMLEYDRKTWPFGGFGSKGFHSMLNRIVLNKVQTENLMSDEKVSVQPIGSVSIKDSDRKACSVLKLMWNDNKTTFVIPVDIVPSLHVDKWPEGATTNTWLMNEEELRSRGYVLVPKPPHAASDLAKDCTEEQLKFLWKISFPHLETEHMQRLEQRVKDVYITAKCLRDPDVCRIMITDDGSLSTTVGKYVTSYQLKMCFFKNVDCFRQHHMSLEEMVCKVYDDLVLGLSKNFIPLFFLPKVSALSGIKLDVPKSLKVAKIMARFVRALYLRDSLGDITDGGDDIVMTVYQRNPRSVYRIHDISAENVDGDGSDDQIMTVYQRKRNLRSAQDL